MGTTAAASKARLMTTAAQVLADSDLPGTARLMLLHLIATSWPHDDGSGWAAQCSFRDLGRACAVADRRTIRAAAELLEAHKLVRISRGRGQRCTTWVLCIPGLVGASRAPSEGAPDVPSEGASDARPTLSVDRTQDTPPKPPQGVGAGRGGDSLLARISRRPAWVSSGPWIDEHTARRLAGSAQVSDVSLAAALRAARERHQRGQLRDPAAFVVSRLRSPRASEVTAERERRARIAARAAVSPPVAVHAPPADDHVPEPWAAADAAHGPHAVDAAIHRWITTQAPAHLAGLRSLSPDARRRNRSVRLYQGQILELMP